LLEQKDINPSHKTIGNKNIRNVNKTNHQTQTINYNKKHLRILYKGAFSIL
jgi:hypothetical protein